MKFILTFILLLTSPLVFSETFNCKSAKINITLIPNKKTSFPTIKETILKVEQKDKDIKLRFFDDYFGIECRKNPQGKYYIIFQSYCSGGGCRDLDNFGIINPDSLQVLLVPNDENRRTAEKIFGQPLTPLRQREP